LDYEDAVQGSILFVLERAHLYSPNKGKETTFIHTVTKNYLINLIRREVRRNHGCLVEDMDIRTTGREEIENLLLHESLSEDAIMLLNYIENKLVPSRRTRLAPDLRREVKNYGTHQMGKRRMIKAYRELRKWYAELQ